MYSFLNVLEKNQVMSRILWLRCGSSTSLLKSQMLLSYFQKAHKKVISKGVYSFHENFIISLISLIR